MAIPDSNENMPVSQVDAASQRDCNTTAALPVRRRGPHPLPLFLETLARACQGDKVRLARALRGLRRYQDAPAAIARPPHRIVAQVGNVTLRDHCGQVVDGAPTVMVPSLINPPTVLDLAPGNSLLGGLAARGVRPLLVDWGPTDEAGLEELVETRLVPLIAALGAPVALAGYCLGGTLALAAAALLGDRVTRLALLATPWHFSGYGARRAELASWWTDIAPLATSLGAVPMELLQPAFWSLDPAALAVKYERFADMAEGPEADAFIKLEDWSNTGHPLSLQAAQGLANDLFRDDKTGAGAWTIGNRAIDPARLDIPILDIIAARDNIVPPSAALSTTGPGTPLSIDSGHVGMVVGRRAPALLWDPLGDWLKSPV